MLKRLIIAAVGVAGLIIIGLGIASATVWRADDVLVATTSGGSHTLVTDPGVLELGGDPVTVRVSVPDGGAVVLAVGRDTDVAGWVGTDAHAQVTGLSGWHTLAVDDVAAPEPTPTPTPTDAAAAPPADAAVPTPAPTEGEAAAPVTVADPTGSDLWVAQETGTGSAELVWPAQEGRWSLLAVSTGESAPTLSLAWPRVVTTPWLWPCVAVGTLLVLLAGWLLLRDVRRHRAGHDEPEWHAVHTGATPAVVIGSADIDAIPVLTRRQLREATQARAARPRTGSVPAVPAPVSESASGPASAPSTAPSAPVGSSRRALRTPTGPIPVAPSAPEPERAVPVAGWTPTPPPRTAETFRSGGQPAPTTSRPTGAPAPTPARTAGPPAPTTSRPEGPSAPMTSRPAGPPAPATSRPAGPPAPTTSSPATPPSPNGPPGERAAAPHGRPSWAQPSTSPLPPPAAAPPASTAGSGPSNPAGWSAVPPPPGARLRPGSPAGPDAEPVHTGRPTWMRTTTPPAPGADESATAGSRADAWRRAWGLPPTEATPEGAQPATDTKEEDR
ncbi:hypothetical protein HP550_04360 [Cellulomonas humilata]|uniref:Uncharacterized protein n=1 Tax=Cellulomonas humilata TaxID=144055 RepID=A0A7Y6DWC4_9CELL|nr:hypothetical protein [Cellulomonas humilata]NUU16478.1 hypothetical protein [Cellulomonas humilata]